jgi:hypothetical protein
MLILFFFLSNFAYASSSLDGVWQGPCSQNGTRTEVFQGQNVSLIERNFNDAACTDLNIETESAGTFVLGQESQPQFSTMDFSFTHVYITLHSNEAVAYYVGHQMCEISSWSLGNRQEVTGLRCDLFGSGTLVQVPKAGDMRYGIYSLQGTQLFFGSLTPQQNSLSVLTRPTSLDPTPYQKQDSL